MVDAMWLASFVVGYAVVGPLLSGVGELLFPPPTYHPTVTAADVVSLYHRVHGPQRRPGR